MKKGCGRPLYLLPFDERRPYVSGMFHLDGRLTGRERLRVAESKQLIYEGFKRAVAKGVPKECAGILVDEEFGAHILSDAARGGYVTALPLERDGQGEFDFEYAEEFGRHLEMFDPAFAKALVRYNPGGDADLNRRQEACLHWLSTHCRRTRRALMLELLIPPTRAQLDGVGGYPGYFDTQVRPALIAEAVQSLQAAGVEPDVWMLEGMARPEDCVGVVAAARRGGRTGVSCVVSCRGAEQERVEHWLEAAGASGFDGFAVGRATFWAAVAAYEAGENTSEEAADFISMRFSDWVDVFDYARARPHAHKGAGHAFGRAFQPLR
jgi:myo-inositol catabolism protein IolC